MRLDLHGLRGDIEKQREIGKLRMEDEQWIRLRNDLVTQLVDKRRELGRSQSEIAKALNTDQGNIARFENLRLSRKGAPVTPHNPTLKFLSAYAEALGCVIDFRVSFAPKADSE